MLENDVDNIDQSFCYELDAYGKRHIIDLMSDGQNTLVTNENKITFVNLFYQFQLKEEISDQINSFIRGFDSVLPIKKLAAFLTEELDQLVSGASTIDLQDMKKYSHFDSSFKTEYRDWFWAILGEFSQEELSRFLYFVTGSPNVSFGGFQEQPIKINRCANEGRLPVAHTWHSSNLLLRINFFL